MRGLRSFDNDKCTSDSDTVLRKRADSSHYLNSVIHREASFLAENRVSCKNDFPTDPFSDSQVLEAGNSLVLSIGVSPQ